MKRLTIAIVCFLGLATPAAAKSPLTGTFATTIRGAKPAALNGRWLVVFKASGAYEIDRNELAVVIGRATVSSKEITFAAETGPLACPTPGRYRWALVARTLKLTVIHDVCVGRRTVLTSHPLVRR